MGEAPEEKTGATFSVDLVKLAPYIIAIAACFIAYGRNTSSADSLKEELTATRAALQELTNKQEKMMQDFGELKGTVDAIQRQLTQDAAYRSGGK